MRVINNSLLDITSQKAKESPRLRMNYNFHKDHNDPINRLLNAIEPDSYIRPHRHRNPAKEEIFFLLRGKAVLFLFDDNGGITEQLYISPQEGVYGAEIDGSQWHSLLVLEKNTVVYEVKEGPFRPINPEDLAPWSPEASEIKLVTEYLTKLRSALEKSNYDQKC